MSGVLQRFLVWGRDSRIDAGRAEVRGHGADEAFVLNPALPTPENPWEIKYIVTDYDGTLSGSYASFEAAEIFTRELHSRHDNPPPYNVLLGDVVSYIRNHASVESMIHDPAATLETVARAYLSDHEHHLCIAVKEYLGRFNASEVEEICGAIARSFSLFSHVKDFIARANHMGTRCDIFTNTNARNIARRINMAGLSAGQFGAVHTLVKSDAEADGVYSWARTEAEIALTKILRPYRAPKPNPGPIEDTRRSLGLRPQDVLMIGEGIADLGSVLEFPQTLSPSSRLRARFAFQEHGARLTEPQAGINHMLRKNHPLGHAHFERTYPLYRNHPGILVLGEGFKTLMEMMNSGALLLQPTPRQQLSFASPQEVEGVEPIARRRVFSLVTTRGLQGKAL